MVIRNILLFDNCPHMRRILRNKISGNLDDIRIHETSEMKEVREVLKGTQIHLIVYSWHSSDAGGLCTVTDLRSTPGLRRAPILLVTTDREMKAISDLLSAGATEYLLLPCKAELLTETINWLCNPLNLRKSKRYSFSWSTVLLQQGEFRFGGKLINISESGLLCEFDWPGAIDWGSPVTVRCHLWHGKADCILDGLVGQVVSLRTTEYNSDHTPRTARVAFAFIEGPPDAFETLKKLFLQLESEEEHFLSSDKVGSFPELLSA